VLRGMALTGSPETNDITSRIIQAESKYTATSGQDCSNRLYDECLAFELRARGIRFERQQKLPIVYKGVRLEYGFRLDLVVEDLVVVEVKAVAEILEVHRCQLLTYLRFSGRPVGLILNFNVPLLKDGIGRVVNDGHGPILPI
jgi:GxxExxY protein